LRDEWRRERGGEEERERDLRRESDEAVQSVGSVEGGSPGAIAATSPRLMDEWDDPEVPRADRAA
jgi:hypothetical protein